MNSFASFAVSHLPLLFTLLCHIENNNVCTCIKLTMVTQPRLVVVGYESWHTPLLNFFTTSTEWKTIWSLYNSPDVSYVPRLVKMCYFGLHSQGIFYTWRLCLLTEAVNKGHTGCRTNKIPMGINWKIWMLCFLNCVCLPALFVSCVFSVSQLSEFRKPHLLMISMALTEQMMSFRTPSLAK